MKMLACKVKISIALLGSFISLVAGDLDFNNFGTFSFDGRDDLHQPWYESSDSTSRYVGSHDNFNKKIPTEDKSLKKSIFPLHALADYEGSKVREIMKKSVKAYCQEIAAKDTSTQASRDPDKRNLMTCYRCKDPKDGSVYEHCSYTSKSPSVDSRQPRSNVAEQTVDSLTAQSEDFKNIKSSTLPGSYKFNDDYFQSEATLHAPSGQEKNIDNCKRVVKDSMICMVCSDPHTNGKYEQCSYVAQPNEKAYAYTKSSSFGTPKEESRDKLEKSPKKKPKKHGHRRREEEDDEIEERESEAKHRDYRREEPEEYSNSQEVEKSNGGRESVEDKKSRHVSDHPYYYPSYKDYKTSIHRDYDGDADGEDAAPTHNVKANCKTVQKDGQSCTICTNAGTGGKSENCVYSHEPNDKSYKYSKSKSFGYPESKERSNYGYSDEKSSESAEKPESESVSDENYGSYAGQPSSLDYIRSESEKISKNVNDQSECREEKRDSMICTVCKDPSTGDDFERCNYSYDPEDKVFAYSKSKSFGSPTKESDEASSSSSSSSSSAEERPEESYSSPVIYPTGTSPIDYIPKASERKLSRIYSTDRPQEKLADSRVDTGFYDATIRRAEIEKIVKDIGGRTKDRSNCRKIQRGDMTCYNCKDPKGFQSEECVYVTDDTQMTSPTAAASQVEAINEPGAMTTAEPMNWTSVAMKRKARDTDEKSEGKEEEEEEEEEGEEEKEEEDEAEPYDYVAETRPAYDKVFRVTLPAYMVERSKHEVEFDDLVKNSNY